MPLKLTPYRKLLVLSKEAVSAALAPVRARSAHKQAELEMLKIEESMANLESKITEACSKYPINFAEIIDKQDEFALLERRKAQFQTIIEEMFP